ncbi:hypothetical protein PUN28_011380 [Cardiocondyla obscurior]|uniref:Uncharacterized protein n=1 Tax=Cardiocondyla obscurior TaxID=286306 RepID=A0AAW2FDK6_9HYME
MTNDGNDSVNNYFYKNCKKDHPTSIHLTTIAFFLPTTCGLINMENVDNRVKTDVGFTGTLNVHNDTAVTGLPVEASEWKRSNDRLCPSGLRWLRARCGILAPSCVYIMPDKPFLNFFFFFLFHILFNIYFTLIYSIPYFRAYSIDKVKQVS